MLDLQVDDGVLSGVVQRAQSCTLQQPLMHPQQPRDRHGYLEPVSTPKGRPRYLELIGDADDPAAHVDANPPGAVGGAAGHDVQMGHGNQHLAASAPVLNPVGSRLPPSGAMPNGAIPRSFQPINYAELDADSLEGNLDRAHHRARPGWDSPRRTGDAGYTPMSQQNGYLASSRNPAGRSARRSGAHNRSGSNEPFLQIPAGAMASGIGEDPGDLDPGSDSEHESRRLLGGRERRKSSSPFLRDLSPFIDRRRGTSPLLRDLSPFHHAARRGSSDSSSVRYNELDRDNHSNDGYLKPRNHDNDGYLKPRDRPANGRPPLANGTARHQGYRPPSSSH